METYDGRNTYVDNISCCCIHYAGCCVLQNTKSKSFDNSFRETLMDILKKRYAKGEITKEEFDRMKKDLKN